MLTKIQSICDQLVTEFDQIPVPRKTILEKIASYIQGKTNEDQSIRLVYVCTHNSRRSHFGQVWGKIAAEYFSVRQVQTYSAGTEATAMHPNTVNALRNDGFLIESQSQKNNPHYSIHYDDTKDPLIGFSKTIEDISLPKSHFAAIMTCAEAEENCPFVPGAELRISTTYEDPKAFDGTPLQDQMYETRSLQIARDNLYIFSKINVKK